MRFLVSAGEASGDMYAARVISRLSAHYPDATFYGCAGPRLKKMGVQPVVDSGDLAVVGLAEVVGHLPRIYGEYRKLVRFAERNRPDAALLTDSPDFHLRVARHLKQLGVPVFYLVAPQVWAWRESRVKTIRQRIDKLFCLFPFEEDWFRSRGVDATYIGHPLASMAKPQFTREDFFQRHQIDANTKLVTLLPGSRAGEIQRHLPILLKAAAELRQRFGVSFVLASRAGFGTQSVLANFREPIQALSIKVVDNETWDCLTHAQVALAASGTVTIEAAVLGTPMVTFYKVSPLSWWAGRRLVKVPFLSMVNLIAERQIVPELIQDDMTPGNIAAAAAELLTNPERAERMKEDLARVSRALTREGEPLDRAAELTIELCEAKYRLRNPSLASSGRQ